MVLEKFGYERRGSSQTLIRERTPNDSSGSAGRLQKPITWRQRLMREQTTPPTPKTGWRARIEEKDGGGTEQKDGDVMDDKDKNVWNFKIDENGNYGWIVSRELREDNTIEEKENNEESPYSSKQTLQCSEEEQTIADYFHEWIKLISDPSNNIIKDLEKECGHCFPECLDKCADDLEGFVVEKIIMGESKNVNREVFFQGGIRHGFYREMDGTGKLFSIGTFLNGRKTGIHWIRYPGNSFYVGEICDTGQPTDQNGIYFYPDLLTVIQGNFIDGKLVKGTRVKLKSFERQLGIPFPKVDSVSPRTFHFSPSSGTSICSRPIMMDPYEMRHVYVAPSTVPGGGEGLFTKTNLKAGQLAAFFNGVRVMVFPGIEFSDYRLHVTKDLCLDIREGEASLENYRATLGHKACHSFRPNAKFSAAYHPQYGDIMALVAVKEVEAGQELLVCYNYEIGGAPEWYQQLWFKHSMRFS